MTGITGSVGTCHLPPSHAARDVLARYVRIWSLSSLFFLKAYQGLFWSASSFSRRFTNLSGSALSASSAYLTAFSVSSFFVSDPLFTHHRITIGHEIVTHPSVFQLFGFRLGWLYVFRIQKHPASAI